MGATLTLVNLAGAIALLMWGVYMVQSGVQRAFGAGLKRFLSRALSSRPKAAAAGLGATAIMQSSTATGLIVASFAAAGVMPLATALAVMLGANVGTTLIVQALSFNVTQLAPLPILAGVAMFRAGGRRTRDLGRVAIGLGLMLLALSLLLSLITPYEDAPSLRLLMGAVATDPLVACLFGALMAWAAHSSVAVVMLIVSFAAKGVVPLEAALALALGANLGSALNPLLEGGRGEDPASRRLGVGNFAIRLAGAAAVAPALGWLGPRLAALAPDAGRAVANFHTAFNLALALAFMPALGPVARLLEKALPRRMEAPDPGQPLYLDATARDTPSIALGCAARETLRMADLLDTMLDDAADALRRSDRAAIAQVRKQDDALDRLDAAIKRYIADLDPDGLADDEHARLDATLAFALNLEGAGDVVERELMDCAAKLDKRGTAFDAEAQQANDALLAEARANLRTASSVFMTSDLRAARALAAQKAAFRQMEAEAMRRHFDGMRGKNAGAIARSALRLDILRAVKRINDQIVAGAAYPVLEAAGELMTSRLAGEAEG